MVWELVDNLDLEYLLFSSYTLGITVTAKSHWFPQLLPYCLLMLLLERL